MPKTTTMNVADAKRHLADLLGRVAYSRETITITRRGKPLARLVPVDADTPAPHVADA
jgi:prevent-host-death family protein